MRVRFLSQTVLLFSLLLPFEYGLAATSSLNETIEMALNMPLKNRVAVFRKTGAQGFFKLKKMVFDKSRGVQAQWRALTTLAIVYGEMAQPVVKKASKSKAWYLRNASVIAAKYCGKKFAAGISKELLTDSALMVRTAAVVSIKKLDIQSARPMLWNEIKAAENFRKKQSLWVRRYIAEALVQFAQPEDDQRFMNMLYDSDPSVAKQAIRGLEKLTQQRFVKAKTLKSQRETWQAWWLKQQVKRY